MPSAMARARYHVRLFMEYAKYFVIEVRPKLRGDAANWRQAYLVLSKETYLPDTVELFNNGTSKTIYKFVTPEVNKTGLLPVFMVGDPFNPSLWTYRREVHANPNAGNVETAGMPRMPSLIGQPGADAKKTGSELTRQGFRVAYIRGPSAPTREQSFEIMAQNPPPLTPLHPRDRIEIKFYDRYVEKTSLVTPDR
jgi:hypothetical protein